MPGRAPSGAYATKPRFALGGDRTSRQPRQPGSPGKGLPGGWSLGAFHKHLATCLGRRWEAVRGFKNTLGYAGLALGLGFSLPPPRHRTQTLYAEASVVPAKNHFFFLEAKRSGLDVARASKPSLEGKQPGRLGECSCWRAQSGERPEVGLQRRRLCCPLLGLEGLLGGSGFRTFLPRHVQLSPDPQFPGGKQGHLPGALCTS